MAIKAVLFDLDNTLIDFWGSKETSINAAIDAMIAAGLKMPKKKALQAIFELYKRYGIEHGKIFQKFLLKVNGTIDMRLLSAGVVAYRNVQASYHKPYDGMEKTIRALRSNGYKLGVISDAPSLKAWIRLTEIGLADYFDAIIAWDDTRKRKPSKEPFILALRKMKIRPENVLYIGDNPARDIKGAKQLGMRTALALYGMHQSFAQHAEKHKADYTLKKPQDILKIVRP